MSIHLNIKKNKRSTDYLFVDDVSFDEYRTALFRLTFKHDTLNEESINNIREYLKTISDNLVEVLNNNDNIALIQGSHETRIKALEKEIVTLTNNINSQLNKHGTLKITPTTNDMNFNNDGTMLKFIDVNGGVYTSGILEKDVEKTIVLPIGEYIVNIVNSLNDMKDSVFEEVWENSSSDDNNHTLKYTIVEGETSIQTSIKYE